MSMQVICIDLGKEVGEHGWSKDSKTVRDRTHR
jgi:hypothetical protein